MLIGLPQPFDVDLTLRAALGSSFGNHYRPVAPRRLRRLLMVDGLPTVVEWGFGGDGLNVLNAGTGTPSTTSLDQALLTLTRHIWSLDDDLGQCHDTLAQFPDLGWLADRYRGYRILRAPSLLDAFMVAVAGQAISATAARAIRWRLTVGFGSKVQLQGQEYYADPSPEQMLAAGLDGLIAFGLTSAKARCLLDVAARVATGDLDEARFAGLSDDEAMSRLTALPGVGRWTAQVVLVYGLGRNDVFMPGDRALANAVRHVRGLATRPSQADLQAISAASQPWRSYAAAYLLMALKDSVSPQA